MFNVFADPSQVFDEVKDSPPCAANWLTPALILIVLGWLGAWIVFSQDTTKHQIAETIERSVEQSHLPPEQADRAREMGLKIGFIIAKVAAVAGPPIAAFVTPFWGAFLLWLVGAKILKGDFPFMKAVEIAGLINMLGLLESILRTLLILVRGDLYATASLTLLLEHFDPQSPTHALLAAVDVITLWVLALRAVAVARLSRASFAKALCWLLGLWVVLNGLKVGYLFAIQALRGLGKH